MMPECQNQSVFPKRRTSVNGQIHCEWRSNYSLNKLLLIIN